MLRVSTEFYPMRLPAYTRTHVDLMLKVKNDSPEPLWVEADILLPEPLSLSDEKHITKARVRVGLLMPNSEVSRPVKVFGSVVVYPNTYTIHLTFFSYNRYGNLSGQYHVEANLRCEKVSG